MSDIEKIDNTGSVAPALVAVGVAVALVGVVVSPLVIAPLGAAVALGAGAAWLRRRDDPGRQPTTEAVSPPPVPDEDRFPRNRFLERATLALGGLVALGVSLPAASFAILPSFLGKRPRAIDLGPISAFPEGEFVVATFLTDAQAGEVSRRAAYIRNNGLIGELPSFTIMSSRCTHVGCPTQPNGPLFGQRRRSFHTASGEVGFVPAQPSGFGCPCHGSQFDTEGNRTAGPAARALDRYSFSVRNGRLILDQLYSVSHVDNSGAQARIHAFALTGDGQPVTGVESWLYPIPPPS